MHEYDVAFKLILQQSGDLTIRELAGTAVARWLNVELPEVRNTRVDLLGETAAGELIHIELQSTNDPAMPLRMIEYCLRVFRLFGRFPQQILLYVGEPPLHMEAELRGPALQYSYRLVDIRDMDGQRLLDSPRVGDNIVAILTRLPDLRASVHRIVEQIARLGPGEREAALRRLLILAGLRHLLGEFVEEEARHMPILNDILDHEVLGREYKKGVQQGIQQGVQQGVQQGELALLLRQAEKRFGAIPPWAAERLAKLSAVELEAVGLRIFDARSLEDLLR